MSLIAEIGRSLANDRSDSDLLVVIEDDEGFSSCHAPPPQTPAGDRAWRLLVVDDDIEVHATTSFALAGLEILGRRLELLHAHSGAGALEILRTIHSFDPCLACAAHILAPDGRELSRVTVQ